MPITYTPEYWDHERDLCKVDRPHRFDRGVPDAVAVAAAVKQVDLLKGAELIEAFAASERERIQLEAVAAGST